jgi:hypothetical protein
MNTHPSQNITVLHDSREWTTELEGEIGEIRVDGKRLNDIHDLALKVEGIAQSIKTLILCLGVILMISLICNIGLATWVLTHDGDIIDAIRQILATEWQHGPRPL